MVITHPNNLRENPPVPNGFMLDSKVKTEKFASQVLDEEGHPTDEVVTFTRSRVVETTEMPIDQTLDAEMFGVDQMVENGMQMNLVKGFNIGSESPESVSLDLSSAVVRLGQLGEELKAKHSPKQVEPKQVEPKQTEPFVQTQTT